MCADWRVPARTVSRAVTGGWLGSESDVVISRKVVRVRFALARWRILTGRFGGFVTHPNGGHSLALEVHLADYQNDLFAFPVVRVGSSQHITDDVRVGAIAHQRPVLPREGDDE